MATFILLHGSFHAAWNWHRVIPLLEQLGHRAIAPDLPGHGRDRTPTRQVTLARCVDALLQCIDAQPQPVVLVAHSRNGIVISQAAEQRPDRIAGLVYLAAYLVPDGRSMMEYALQDSDSLVVQNVETSLDRRLLPLLVSLFRSVALQRLCALLLPQSLQQHRLKRSVYREALYHDCGDEITALANVLLEAEPNWAGFTPLRLSASRYGSVPKVYVECLQDRAVTPSLQRKMHGEHPCDRVLSIDSGHSPFFSQPGTLVERLLECLALFSLSPRAGIGSKESAHARKLERRRYAASLSISTNAPANRWQSPGQRADR
ncbi:MAG TPA: alpha/beta fold hydrolase [Solimonas sp.]|nr:alpha/beta fold hydrolase [Solimonas sp.]